MKTWLLVKNYVVESGSIDEAGNVKGELVSITLTQFRKFRYGMEIPVGKTFKIEAETLEEALTKEGTLVDLTIGEPESSNN